VIDSIDLNVENVESYGIEHVDALGGGGSFDYGSLVDLGMGPLLISAFTSYDVASSPLVGISSRCSDPASKSERWTAYRPAAWPTYPSAYPPNHQLHELGNPSYPTLPPLRNHVPYPYLIRPLRCLYLGLWYSPSLVCLFTRC
jgi:hypothetical protein